MQTKEYIGDGVYVEVKGEYEIVLTAEDGKRAYETIVLEYSMIEHIQNFVDDVIEEAKRIRAEGASEQN